MITNIQIFNLTYFESYAYTKESHATQNSRLTKKTNVSLLYFEFWSNGCEEFFSKIPSMSFHFQIDEDKVKDIKRK